MTYFETIAARNAPLSHDALQPLQAGAAVPFSNDLSEQPPEAPILQHSAQMLNAGVRQLQPNKDNPSPKNPSIRKEPRSGEDLKQSPISRRVKQAYLHVIEHRQHFAEGRRQLLPAKETMDISDPWPEETFIAKTESLQPMDKTGSNKQPLISGQQAKSNSKRPNKSKEEDGEETITLLHPQQHVQPDVYKAITPATAAAAQTEPRLTIGKITVEIIAPEKLSRQFSSTAPLHIPPRPASSWSKHRFGLNQL